MCQCQDNINPDPSLPCGCWDAPEILEPAPVDCGCSQVNFCIESLLDKFEPGSGVGIATVGSGCDKKLQLSATTLDGGLIDQYVKTSSADTTAAYLQDKIVDGVYVRKTVADKGAGELALKLDVTPEDFISIDSGNTITKGMDGKLKVILESTAQRDCFDGVWKDLPRSYTSNDRITYTSGTAQYRIRPDGVLEFRGSLTYAVQFGAYSTPNYHFSFNLARLPYSCLTQEELSGNSELKSIWKLDPANGSNIPQQYGYTLSRNGQNLIADFQSSFLVDTQKSIRIDFDNVISQPNR